MRLAIMAREAAWLDLPATDTCQWRIAKVVLALPAMPSAFLQAGNATGGRDRIKQT